VVLRNYYGLLAVRWLLFISSDRPFSQCSRVSKTSQVQGGGRISDPLHIFLRTENCSQPKHILENKSISESIICIQRENLSIGFGAEELF
jgi:hypothetical protein